MKAVDTSLLNLLKKASQFVVPIYQRPYSWGKDECLQLWRDITRAGKLDDLGSHFTGSIVYVSKGVSTITSTEPDLIIDGQQRVTTVVLMLRALASHLSTLPVEDQEVAPSFSPQKINDRYLIDGNEDGDRRFKLLLSEGDREALKAILQGFELEPFRDSKLVQNFEILTELVTSNQTNLVELCRGLEKLVVVEVQLDRGHDNPQLVFEAMNSTGKKLSQADLIRNFTLMNLNVQKQAELYDGTWRPLEKIFSGADETHFDTFVRHYLTVKTGEIPRVGDVYEAFKEFAFAQISHGGSISEIAADLRKGAVLYQRIALGVEPEQDLRLAFSDLEQIKADVVTPFMLKVYFDYEAGLVSLADFVQIVHYVVSYVFRRVVCKIPTNSMNKTFATLGSLINEDSYLESVAAQLLNLQSYRRFPTDDEFIRELKASDLYNFRRRSYLLRKLENHGRKEPVSIEEYTIEHILPQNPNLSMEWQNELGPEWKAIQEKYLHTLGNLTLTAYNPELSDKPFLKKRDHSGGFAHSALNLNAGLRELEHWGPTEIEARAGALSLLANRIWARPVLEQSLLSKYVKNENLDIEHYGIQDHPYLTGTVERAKLFEKLDEQILALDPVVVRKFRQLYVAYKAESNFVQVVPQVSKMNLSLNISITELVDPRGLARDVSHLSRWGTGDVEVELDESSDFEYVFGLIRQAFELQLDGDL